MGERVAYELVRSMPTLSLQRKMREMEHCLVHHLYESNEWRDTYEYIYDVCKDELERRKSQAKKEEELKEVMEDMNECGFI